MADIIDYQIFGEEMQYVEIELDPGEAAIGEAGGMMYMQESASLPAILSSHPASEDRFETVDKAMPKDKTFDPLPYDIKKLNTP